MPKPLTDRIGINAVEKIFLDKFEWIFREQPVADWGIDAQVEVMKEGKATGKLFALQIKTGSSYFRNTRDEGFVFYGDERHYNYWINHSLPVFLILHEPEADLTLWQKIEPHLVTMHEGGRWSILVPSKNALSPRFKANFEAGLPNDEASSRRLLIMLDLPTIREFAKQQEVYLQLDDWVNKSLNMRGVEVRFDDPDKDVADYTYDSWLPFSDPDDLMAKWFPWLDYNYDEEEDNGSGEVVTHKLSAHVNEIGRAAIVLDDFFQNGVEPKQSEPIEDDLPDYDDFFDEEAFQAAVAKDAT